MTQLKKEMAYNIATVWLFEGNDPGKLSAEDLEIITKAAASVAQRFIEKAYDDGADSEYEHHINGSERIGKEKWLKENGVIPNDNLVISEGTISTE